MQQLSAQDAQFLYMESEDNLTHVTAVYIYDPSTASNGKVRFKDIIHSVESRLDASPIFRRRLVHVPFELDYPYWIADEFFDIEFHIRHGRLPEPADWRQFCIHMARYHSRPLAMQRPPWEMYVVEGLDNVEGLPAGSYAIATKIHHAAVDGASATKFFGALHDVDATGTPALEATVERFESSRRPKLPEMLGRALINNVTSPVRMIDTVMRSAPMLYQAFQNVLRPDDDSAGVPDTPFNVPVSAHKMFDASVFDLHDLKIIKQAVEDSTINDVVLAVCGGGLRRYLQHHGQLPDRSLVAWVPINARPNKSVSADSGRCGNRITAMTSRIFTDIEDPVVRLCEISKATRRSKEAKSGLSARLMTDLTQHVPAATQLIAGRLVLRVGMAPRLCNLFISNVPGPQTSLYLAGAKMLQSFGMAPLANGMGLFIATPSYNGQISFSVTSTREIMPDIGFFMECLRDSLQDSIQASNELASVGDGRAPKTVTP
ncbi:MAG: wax ester/triacylglycerol synthase family O-acyltransferase [Woeseia sp.]